LSETRNELTKSEKAPTSGEGASAQEREGQKRDSVLDFLYHDHRRIASFLAQFETYGILQQVKATESVGRIGSSRTTHSAGLDLVTVAKAGITVDGTVSDDERDSAERTYDPLWTNARTFMKYLDEGNMIEPDLSRARLGQFVRATGSLAILDLVMMQSAWKLPTVQTLIKRGALAAATLDAATTGQNRHQRRKDASTGAARPSETSEADLMIDLLSMLPHAVQARLNGVSVNVWCSLRQESIVGASSDLVLKHGITVPGEWHILGILDAMPDQAGETGQDELPPAFAGSLVGQLAESLAPVTRKFLGRPPEAYGMTPLLIYRNVSGAA
jgi:hypothetical protein